ncbi:MAG: dihydrofolate reductase family protein [Alphaproteobacteria bacterium]
MRKVRLFIAMSLDGYIADSCGRVDWLNGQGNGDEATDTYSEFVKNIDTILMGWNTYNQIVTELSPEKWVYNDFITYVITHKGNSSCEKIRFTNISPINLVKRLKQQNGKDIWIYGGANIVQQLVNENLIDYYQITIIPIILGKGIRLFESIELKIKMKLLTAQSYNGMIYLTYTRR